MDGRMWCFAGRMTIFEFGFEVLYDWLLHDDNLILSTVIQAFF